MVESGWGPALAGHLGAMVHDLVRHNPYSAQNQTIVLNITILTGSYWAGSKLVQVDPIYLHLLAVRKLRPLLGYSW